MPPASHQVSATSLKLLIQQIHPHERVVRAARMCVARDLMNSSWQAKYGHVVVAGASHEK